MDTNQTGEIQIWIEQLLDYTFELNFFEELKSGVILCEILNKIQPGTCHKYVNSKYGYVHRRNIDTYLSGNLYFVVINVVLSKNYFNFILSGCRSLGIKKDSCFNAKDLLSNKNLDKIIANLYAVNDLAKNEIQSFDGPYIIKLDKLKSLILPITNDELSQLQKCTSLHNLLLVFVKQVNVKNYRNLSYWKTFKKCLRAQLQLINDADLVDKLLNSAYMISEDDKNGDKESKTLKRKKKTKILLYNIRNIRISFYK